MRALFCCEFSGIVRDAFKARGHDAWSCDFLATEREGQHIQGDLRSAIQESWDFVGFHTDCTYMTNSGVRWLHEQTERWVLLDESCELFNLCLRYPCKGYLENPIPHKYAVQRIDRNYDQLIQPWQFGHGETKATCLWLKGIPKLIPTEIVSGRSPKVHHASPGPDRWKYRSRTLQGIANAYAAQWG